MPHGLHAPAIDMTRCRASVWHDHGSHQCHSKGIERAEGMLWCKVHNPERVKAKSEAREAKTKAESAAMIARWEYDDALRKWKAKVVEAIRSIAAGHNDPIALARELVAIEPRKVVPTSES